MNRKTKKASKTNTNINKRFSIIAIVFFVLIGIVAARLVWILVVDGDKYKKAALKQTQSGNFSIPAKRGEILDRNSVQLVTSTKVYNLILDPKVILTNEEKYLEPTISLIEKHFGISKDELKKDIEENPKSSYVVLKKGLTYTEVEKFIKEKEDDITVNGVWLEDNYKRNYTYNTLASSVLGFTNNGVGEYGLELQYDKELTGTDGMEYSYINSDNTIETIRREPVDGDKIMLTLDYNIEAIVEKYLEETYQKTKSKGVTAIVQNPNTGEILAMADSGKFDCNNPRDLSIRFKPEEIETMDDQTTLTALTEVWRNDCITKSYEPGSTFKPFTVAMGIEENKISPNDSFYCGGSQMFFESTPWEKTIWCWERKGHGTLNVKGAIAMSCNISLAQISGKIGQDIFTRYQRKFGFGQFTGIDLPNEMSCSTLLFNKDNMTDLDLATNAFGQNFNVTMVQLCTGFCSLINGGYLYKPYIVKNIYNANSELVKSNGKTLVSQTISQDTCNYIKECLREVVVNGTSPAAAIPGYKIAGKTGQAQKYDKEEELYVISYIGFAPYDNPEVVCYVALDEPAPEFTSSTYAVELFRNIMAEVLSYMNVAADDIK